MLVKVTALLLVFVVYTCVATNYGTSFDGFQRILPPLSRVANSIDPRQAPDNTNNRWNYVVNVCGKTPRWFASDVSQCDANSDGSSRADCYDLAFNIPVGYVDPRCATCTVGNQGCCNSNTGNGCAAGCNFFCSNTAIDRYNGFCETGSNANEDAPPHTTRDMGSYNDWNFITTPANCIAGRNSFTGICAKIRSTAVSRLFIDSSTGFNIRSTLPRYARRSGIVIEMDIAYGYPSNGNADNRINNAGGSSSNDAIQVEAAIKEATQPSYINSRTTTANIISGGTRRPIELLFRDTDFEDDLYRSNCNTIKWSFDDFNLQFGETYSLAFNFLNAWNSNSGTWYFDALGDWGSDIAVAEIRIYEKVDSSIEPDCNAFMSGIQTLNTVADAIQRRNSFETEREAVGSNGFGNSNGTPLGCDLCVDYNGGDGYCSSDVNLSGDLAFLTMQFANNFNAGGVSPTGGYLILYGAQFDDNSDITLIVNGNYNWVNDKKAVVSTTPVNGVYYFCGNCQYMIWTFDNFDPSHIDLAGGTNTADIYLSGDEKICVAAYQFVFYTKDVKGPTNIADGNNFCLKADTVTYTLRPGTGSSITLDEDTNKGLYYTANTATDNCEQYAVDDVIPVSLSQTVITVWDYLINEQQHSKQRFTVKDHSGAESFCDTYVKVAFDPAIINYPPNDAQLTITNIIVRWTNYGPAIDAQSKVKISIVPTGGCASSPTVILADALSYLTFTYQYRGPTSKIVKSVVGGSTCAYDLHFEISNASLSKSILFINTGLTFYDITP